MWMPSSQSSPAWHWSSLQHQAQPVDLLIRREGPGAEASLVAARSAHPHGDTARLHVAQAGLGAEGTRAVLRERPVEVGEAPVRPQQVDREERQGLAPAVHDDPSQRGRPALASETDHGLVPGGPADALPREVVGGGLDRVRARVRQGVNEQAPRAGPRGPAPAARVQDPDLGAGEEAAVPVLHEPHHPEPTRARRVHGQGRGAAPLRAHGHRSVGGRVLEERSRRLVRGQVLESGGLGSGQLPVHPILRQEGADQEQHQAHAG